jgi:hypothetical protein
MEWYKGLFEPLNTTTTPAVVRQKSVKEDVKKGLLTDLVGVHVRDTYVLSLRSYERGMDLTKV